MWQSRRDITFTEWNTRSNLPSELYKMKAQLFVYGFYDDQEDAISEVVAVNVAGFVVALSRGRLKYDIRTNTRTGQTFMAVLATDLRAAGCVAWPPSSGEMEGTLPQALSKQLSLL